MNGKRLKTNRERAGHTQESLAEQIMISPRNITRYENGESEPGADVLGRIASALNVSSDYLLGLTDDPTPTYRRFEGLSDLEQRIVTALRNGDYREAIKVIVNEE